MNKETTQLHRAYLAWFSCALFFFYQYIIRVAPGVMVEQLRGDFNLTAEEFSTLGAYYLYAYSLLQIPLGLLVDYIGVKKTALFSILLCSLGTGLLAYSEVLWQAQLSRVLVGAGSASAFLCSLKVIADELPAGKRGLFMGLSLMCGTIGALVAGKPLVVLLEMSGWRNALLYTGLSGIFVFCIALIFLPKHVRKVRDPKQKSGMLKNLKMIILDPYIITYAFIAIGLYTPLSVLADLWGTAFIMEKFKMLQADAAPTAMTLYVGLALGSLILPWYCEKKNTLVRGIQICSFSLCFLFSLLLYGPSLAGFSLLAVLLLIGFFCGAEMMCFTGAVKFSTVEKSGAIIGVVNTLNMLGGAFLQQIIGSVLDWHWSGTTNENGLRLYQTSDYVYAFSVTVGIISLCFILSLFLKRFEKEHS